jgi:GNAT superfamily N-acetyltransferase
MVHDEIRIRRVVPDDLPDLERFYAGLSADSRASRFHGACQGISHRQAEMFAAADHLRRDGFVALADGRIIGHLVLEPIAVGSEELALAVDDQFQHHGIGTLLMTSALASARLRRIRRLVAWVMAENSAMRQLIIASHNPVSVDWTGPVARYELKVLAGPRRVAA